MKCQSSIHGLRSAVLFFFSLPAFALLAAWPALSQNSVTTASARYSNVHVDALDGDGWNGVVFRAQAFGRTSSFALRFGTLSGSFVDGPAIFDAVREVGPHAPDGSYCRVSWQVPPRAALITLEWSRIAETTVVGRITAAPDFQIFLETYVPGAAGASVPAVYSLADSRQAIFGQRYFDQVLGTTSQFVVMVDQPTISSGTFPSLDELQAIVKNAHVLVDSRDSEPTRNAAGIEFVTANSPGDPKTAHFVATLGWNRDENFNQAQQWLAPGKIDFILKEKAEAYARRRPSAQGLFEGAPEAIGNSMFWNTLYAPQSDLAFPSISRRWAHSFGGWVLGEWDGFFGSLLTSLEDKQQTLDTLRALLLAQTETGIIPNIVSGGGVTPDRSQPPIGSYCVWKVYQRYPERDFLEWAYPRLKRWHEWWFKDRGDGQPWRDGNRDDLLEWGSDRGSSFSTGGRGFLMQARWESGMDDSPMWDDAHYDPHTYTMDLDDVGLNSLYALDAESLAGLAGLLGKADDQRDFLVEYEKIKQLVRDKLWNDADGIYENRFWGGEFSRRLSPTNFYPMLAGIATPQQARRMVNEHLLNPKEFWGEYVAPTAPRNDPAFADQNYWRGSIWGPTNYLLYHAIERYGFDDVAFQFAAKSYALFMDDWKINQHDNELYNARGGPVGGDIHYTWGALLCLVALEQFTDANPWDTLRFGALNPRSEGTFRGAVWQGHVYDITVGRNETTMARDGKPRFHADAGVVVRNYVVSPTGLSLRVKSDRDFHLAAGEFESGAVKADIDGRPVGQIRVVNGTATFTVPQGEHSVEVSR